MARITSSKLFAAAIACCLATDPAFGAARAVSVKVVPGAGTSAGAAAGGMLAPQNPALNSISLKGMKLTGLSSLRPISPSSTR